MIKLSLKRQFCNELRYLNCPKENCSTFYSDVICLWPILNNTVDFAELWLEISLIFFNGFHVIDVGHDSKHERNSTYTLFEVNFYRLDEKYCSEFFWTVVICKIYNLCEFYIFLLNQAMKQKQRPCK